MRSLSQKSFATGHFEVTIDGRKMTSFIKSVEGGLIKATSTEEATGPYHIKNRHLSTREVEPLSIEMGASGAAWALDVFDDFLSNRRHVRHTGTIVHADTNFREQYRYEFMRALLTEITFPPKLDGKSKDFATIKVKLQPEDIKFQLGEGAQVTPYTVDKQKLWTCSAFRLNIDGLDTRHVTSIEPLTFKLGTKVFQKGGFKLPDYHPTKMDMPKLSFQIPLKFAGSVIEWYRSAVTSEEGTSDAGYERNGSIEILDQTRSKTIYEIELFNMGPEAFTLPRSEANKDEVKYCKFDAYISTVKPIKERRGFV